MVHHCKTAATQAFQIWMKEDMETLGWRHGQVNISGYVEPFDTWADMTQLIKEESLAERVQSIAYFCSVLPDPPVGTNVDRARYPEERGEETRKAAIHFLKHDIGRLWPGAISPGGDFRWDLLASPMPGASKAAGESDRRFQSQFWTANVNPSDRYSLSIPGTLQYRISPLDDSFDNLTVAGDWTDCGFNEGCVEAAVMSGRLAAHAISQLPRLEDIGGFDHP
jgi:hypothetical protein